MSEMGCIFTILKKERELQLHTTLPPLLNLFLQPFKALNEFQIIVLLFSKFTINN